MAIVNTYFITHAKKLCNAINFISYNGKTYMLAIDKDGARWFVSAPFDFEPTPFTINAEDIPLTSKKSTCTITMKADGLYFDDQGPVIGSYDTPSDSFILFEESQRRDWERTTCDKSIDERLFSKTNKACKDIQYYEDSSRRVIKIEFIFAPELGDYTVFVPKEII